MLVADKGIMDELESQKLVVEIHSLFRRNKINHATWCNALRELRGESTTHLGKHALNQCITKR